MLLSVHGQMDRILVSLHIIDYIIDSAARIMSVGHGAAFSRPNNTTTESNLLTVLVHGKYNYRSRHRVDFALYEY